MDSSSPSNPPHEMIVHTLPQKFLFLRPSSTVSGKKIGGYKKTILIGISLVVIFGILMFLAGWLFLKSIKQEQTLPPVNLSAGQASLSEDTAVPPADSLSGGNAIVPPDDDISQEWLDQKSWLTYESAVEEFSLAYPGAWPKEITGDSASPTDYVFNLRLLHPADQRTLFALEITGNIGQPLSLPDWLAVNNTSTDLAVMEDYQLGDVTGLKYSSAENSYHFYFLRNDKFYNFNFLDADSDDLKRIYNEIMAGFKFTSPLVVPDTVEQESKPSALVTAVDQDADGLTDEEEGLFGADPAVADTDGDSYRDGDEVINLYDPLLKGSYKIFNSSSVATYVDKKYNFNIVYPASWEIKDFDDEIIFQADNKDFFEILVQPAGGEYQDVEQWLSAEFAAEQPSNYEVIDISGEQMLLSPDKTRSYLLFGDYVYSFIYNIGLKNELTYPAVYLMFIKSFQFLP